MLFLFSPFVVTLQTLFADVLPRDLILSPGTGRRDVQFDGNRAARSLGADVGRCEARDPAAGKPGCQQETGKRCSESARLQVPLTFVGDRTVLRQNCEQLDLIDTKKCEPRCAGTLALEFGESFSCFSDDSQCVAVHLVQLALFRAEHF